jgi:hypothetical protein
MNGVFGSDLITEQGYGTWLCIALVFGLIMTGLGFGFRLEYDGNGRVDSRYLRMNQ